MREIEVKAKLHDPAGFLAAADKLNITFGAAFTQDDMTYEGKLGHDDPAYTIFRIRVQDGKNLLTMKYHASQRSRDNHEYETTVDDASAIAHMLGRLGYEPGVQIVKRRRVAHYKDMEICLDEIERLGSFVEVEKLTSDGVDVDQVQTELWELLVSLGVRPEDRTHKGYDILMHELNRVAAK